ncbi:MAG: type I secretion system permease/ATPase [Porticoccaceae bacterium]|nr:type I secretion system permease/ATPase [Porticoccaceae bacterium]
MTDAIPISKHDSGLEDPLLLGVQQLLALQGLSLNPDSLRYGMPLDAGRVRFEQLPDLLARQQVSARTASLSLEQLPKSLLPCLLVTRDGQSMVLLQNEEEQCLLLSPVTGGEIRWSQTELATRFSGKVLFAHAQGQDARRADHYAPPPDAHWFRSRLLAQTKWTNVLEVVLASLMAALLSVATALFAMQVYDRVVPTQATETLWALVVGVFIAIVFEFLLRSLRAQLIESGGKRLDIALSRQLFQQAVHLKYAARPESTGAFASQIRDFELVREFFTASTLGACGDLPFTVLFIALIAFIAGPLAWVPIIAIVCMTLPSLLVQPAVSRLAREGLRDAAIKNAVLLESIDHMETVKANRAEGRVLGIWQRLSAEQASRSVSARSLSAWLNSWAAGVQQLGYVSTIIGGVYLIFAGQLTIGALIACSILTSRAVAPMTQVSQLLGRWQQVKVALEGLEDLMRRPVERPADRHFARLSTALGDFKLEQVTWRFAAESPPVLTLDKLHIRSGEHWVLLGGNGAGKSTLLRLLAGLYDTHEGSLRVDDLELSQVDPADKRRLIGYMPQDIALFHGTLRDNLTLDGRHHEDARLLEALDMVGVGDFVRRHPRGLDMFIPGNQSLSGGQRQAVGLARLVLQDTPIVLMDEPTSALDQSTENAVIARLKPWLQGRTLVLATHKMPLLELVDHAIVLNGGRRLLHGPLDSVLKRMNVTPTDVKNTTETSTAKVS